MQIWMHICVSWFCDHGVATLSKMKENYLLPQSFFLWITKRAWWVENG